MTPYQVKALVILGILFVYFYIGMCRAATGSTKEIAYGMLAIFSCVLILGTLRL